MSSFHNDYNNTIHTEKEVLLLPLLHIKVNSDISWRWAPFGNGHSVRVPTLIVDMHTLKVERLGSNIYPLMNYACINKQTLHFDLRLSSISLYSL